VTAYPRPAEREQIVVRLNPCAKVSPSARPSPEHPRTFLPDVAVGECVGFAESRRTGNIEVTFQPHPARQAVGADGAGAPPPILKAAPIALDARPRPHAAMPAATGDFCDDLRTVDAEAPAATQGGMIEELMAHTVVEPGKEPVRCDTGTPAFRDGMDVRLARIIDAWPRLSARTRAAMTATLDDSGTARGPADATSQVGPRPLALRAPRRGDSQTKAAGAPSRRRARAKE
jgi:hypothetical protein